MPNSKKDEVGAFAEWKRKVDLSIASRIGLSSDDLEDQPYWDWFDAGLSPRQAATEAIKYAMEG